MSLMDEEIIQRELNHAKNELTRLKSEPDQFDDTSKIKLDSSFWDRSRNKIYLSEFPIAEQHIKNAIKKCFLNRSRMKNSYFTPACSEEILFSCLIDLY